MGWTDRVGFQAGARDFSLLHSIKTGSGAHPASYLMDNAGSFPRPEANHSPPSSAEIKNDGTIHPLPHTSSWRGA
jgi:hypothetical protein